jgi:hypothetical protein
MLPKKNDPKTSQTEEDAIMTRVRIARFSDYVLREQAWFHSANELMAAMELMEPHIANYWACLRAQFLNEKNDIEPEHSLVNVHMMLAGFVIENFCKGHLAARLTPEERDAVRYEGEFPKALRTHDLLQLVQDVDIKLSDSETDLVKRIGGALWRGRYPSPTSHKGIDPSLRSGSDVRRIKALLQKLRKHVGAKRSYRPETISQ